MSKPLSPAAQAVLDAYNAAPPDHSIHELPPDCGHRALAAALRAASGHGEYIVDPVDGKTAVVRVADLQAWATELEASNA